MKRIVFITNKLVIYEVPHELSKFRVVRQLLRQPLHTMLTTNNQGPLHPRRRENPAKHQSAPKYDDQDCIPATAPPAPPKAIPPGAARQWTSRAPGHPTPHPGGRRRPGPACPRRPRGLVHPPVQLEIPHLKQKVRGRLFIPGVRRMPAKAD